MNQEFEKVIEKFKPGTVINMVSELAIVMEMWTETDGFLYVRVLFARNIGKSTDLLLYNQADAKKYQMDKWQVATVGELTDELIAITSKTPQLTLINLTDYKQLDEMMTNELDGQFFEFEKGD
jgi:hypothetical protein